MITRRSLLRGLGVCAAVTAGSRLSAAQAQTATNPSPRPAAARSASPGAGGAQARGAIAFGGGPNRIALMMETRSDAFVKAAQAVISGVRAAQSVEGEDTRVEVIPLTESDASLPGLCQELAARGYVLAIGPLTRGNVNEIADLGSLPVPVLALNLPDADRQVPANLMFFGLAIETEAEQVARDAFRDAAARPDVRLPLQALTIADSSPLSRRGVAAFTQTWNGLGGNLVAAVEIDAADQDWRSALADVKADIGFVAVNPDALRMVRAGVRSDIPLYGTSQLTAVQLTGAPAVSNDLNGVRLLGMPWLLQPDNAAVMAYPRDRSLRHVDFQRLYALGIDAYRVIREIGRGQTTFDIDGVTGRLHADFAQDLRVDRTALQAEYRDGRLVPVVAPTAPAAAAAPPPAASSAGSSITSTTTSTTTTSAATTSTPTKFPANGPAASRAGVPQ